MKLKYKNLEVIGIYLLLCLVVHILTMVNIIQNIHMDKYEVTLIVMALFLIETRLLGFVKKFKACLILCQIMAVYLCIALYYTVSVIGIIIFIVCLYTTIKVAMIAYGDLKGLTIK